MIPKQIAVFDLDHTLINVNIGYAFGAHLYRSGHVKLPRALYLIGAYLLCKVGIISVDNIHRHYFHSLIKGLSTSVIDPLVDSFLSKNLNTIINPKVLSKLEEAQQQQHHTVLLSSSPDFLVQKIAKKLDFDEWQATRYHLDGISHIMTGERKREIAHDLSQKFGIPMKEVTAFSDSTLDLPLLQSVGRVVVVNPSIPLRYMSYKNKWDIL